MSWNVMACHSGNYCIYNIKFEHMEQEKYMEWNETWIYGIEVWLYGMKFAIWKCKFDSNV